LCVSVKDVVTWLVRNVLLGVMKLVRSVVGVERGSMKFEKQARTTMVLILKRETRLLEARGFWRYRVYNQQLLGKP